MSAHPDHRATAAAGNPAARPRPVAWLMRSLKIAVVALGLSAASFGAYCGVIIYEGNFHAVAPGVLYRSAQLSDAQMQTFVHQYGIKSVLNLRGANPGSPWYDDEVAESRKLGLVHYDYSLSAKRFVTRPQIAAIVAILRRAPKPLLIHCMSGADRSGLVAALYRYVIAGASADAADQQLSLVYGHFPYLMSQSVAMDNSFWAYVHGTTRTAAR
ncbi:MAG TPA: dual specificity protein phosphatase family protein [Stellaceae bacterium]|nr:dual specificity protein phosphatase family protein [Stellaceae bacterium]